MRIAPFYGIRGNGCARWLNRILVIMEIAIGAFLVYMQLNDPIGGKSWYLYVIIAMWYLGVSVLNGVLHKLNSVILAIFYGTTDPDEIIYRIKQRESRKNSAKRKFAKAGLQAPGNFDLQE